MAGLRYKGITAKEVAAMFRHASDAGKREAVAVLREETETIKKISVEQTPVDTGELEAAHKVIVQRNQTDHAHFIVAVEGTFNGVNVDEYVGEIHHGSYNLGPLSQAKQATTSRIVGPGFLSRAFDERVETTIRRVQDALFRGVMNYVR